MCCLLTATSIPRRGGFSTGDEIHLSPKAFELLKTLVDSRPLALSKQELLDRIWPGTFVSDASLARAVSEIREALGEHSRTDGFLQTVHGFGYRFAEAGVTVVAVQALARRSRHQVLADLERTRSSVENGDHAIGREPGVAVQLDSPRVSRFHAKLVGLVMPPSRISAAKMARSSAAPELPDGRSSATVTTSKSGR